MDERIPSRDHEVQVVGQVASTVGRPHTLTLQKITQVQHIAARKVVPCRCSGKVQDGIDGRCSWCALIPKIPDEHVHDIFARIATLHVVVAWATHQYV